MRSVTPQVYLVGCTQPLYPGIEAYLDAVGGLSWLDARVGGMTGQEHKWEHFIGIYPGALLTEFYGRLCYRSFEPGLNANVTKIREDQAGYLLNVLNSGHGSVLEHVVYNFVIAFPSRVFTHELVRHRAGTAISQESMRFVRLDDVPFWLPEWAREDADLTARTVALVEAMEEHQRWMAEHFGLDEPGVPFAEKKARTSFMRRTAPDGVATHIGWSANIRALRWIIQQRTEIAAEEEIRLVFDQIAQIMVEHEPMLFQDFAVDAQGQWVPANRKV